ncbi:MAG: DUF485 domain-containing protein [Candidatus Competibacterales bacterium]
MHSDLVEEIKNHPHYQELVSKRTRFAWQLSAVMLVIYFGFILTIAFVPNLLATPLYEGSVISVGIPVGVAIILIAFALTGLYVARANGEFERMTKAIKQDTKR